MLGCDGFQILQPLCSEADLIPVFIQKTKPKRLQHSYTTVIGGAAADTHDKMSAAILNGIFNYLSHTISGGDQRIFFLTVY